MKNDLTHVFDKAHCYGAFHYEEKTENVNVTIKAKSGWLIKDVKISVSTPRVNEDYNEDYSYWRRYFKGTSKVVIKNMCDCYKDTWLEIKISLQNKKTGAECILYTTRHGEG